MEVMIIVTLLLLGLVAYIETLNAHGYEHQEPAKIDQTGNINRKNE